MLRRAQALKGYTVQAEDGDAGTIADIYFSDEAWAIRYIVVDTGPWLFGRHVLLSPLAFSRPISEEEAVQTNLTRAEVEDSPEIELDKPVSRQQETALHDYYRWPYYWMAVPSPLAHGASAGAVPVSRKPDEESRQRAERPAADPRLRSADEVTGYHIEATNGEIGHVEDFLVDDGAWFVRYLLVDTRNWLPGRTVLLSPAWIERVSWDTSKVYLGVTRKQVEESPEYDPAEPPTRDYEASLFRHYGAPYYWP